MAPGLVLVLALALLGLRLTVWRDTRPGGDDDGRLLRALAAEVPRSLPPGARVVERRESPTYWDGCGRVEELSGWQPVRVLVRAEVPAPVYGDLARHLAGAGWSGPIFAGTWTRRLPNGKEARLMVLGEPPVIGFVFSAQPPGPQPRGC